MTVQLIITLVLAYGILGALCFLCGLMIGANSRTPREAEHHEFEDETPLVRTRVYNRNNRTEI